MQLVQIRWKLALVTLEQRLMDVDLLDALRHLPHAGVNLAGLEWLEDHVMSDHVEAFGTLDLVMLIYAVTLLLYDDLILANYPGRGNDGN